MTHSTCVEPGCGSAATQLDLCGRHWADYRKPHDPQRTACNIRNCNRKRVKDLGYCLFHQLRHERGEFMYSALTREDFLRDPCAVSGCGQPITSKGLCGTHYSRSAKLYKVREGRRSERIDPIEVYKRDGWTCGICGLPTLRDVSVDSYHPMMAVLDHIDARAMGGDHSMENVQTAHHACNSFKRDLSAAELAEYQEENRQIIRAVDNWGPERVSPVMGR